jgi:hypothetical protein
VPAAAVIPALRVCSHIVAVKTPVVGTGSQRVARFLFSSNGNKKTFTVNKSGRLEYGITNYSAQYEIFVFFGKQAQREPSGVDLSHDEW